MGERWIYLALLTCAHVPALAQSVAPPPAPTRVPIADCGSRYIGSPFISVDSWVYPAVLRLFALGYVDSAYIGIRPWTRLSLHHALEETASSLPEPNNVTTPAQEEAIQIYQSLLTEFDSTPGVNCGVGERPVRIESAYTMNRGISGHNNCLSSRST